MGLFRKKNRSDLEKFARGNHREKVHPFGVAVTMHENEHGDFYISFDNKNLHKLKANSMDQVVTEFGKWLKEWFCYE